MRIATILVMLMTSTVASQIAFAQDRMPPLSSEQMSEAQQRTVAEMLAGRKGGPTLAAPFVPLLRSPELMIRVQKTGEYLRFSNALDARLVEFAILITARQWTQQFEWFAHHPLALKAGLKADTVQAIAEGRRPAAMAEDEGIVYDFCDELFRTHGVTDETYGRAVRKFGERGVIDMLGIVGHYTTLAMIMNVARTPLPGGVSHPLPQFPH